MCGPDGAAPYQFVPLLDELRRRCMRKEQDPEDRTRTACSGTTSTLIDIVDNLGYLVRHDLGYLVRHS